MRHLTAFLLFTIMLISACDDDAGIHNQSSQLVVEGWIQNDQFPVVILTRTVPVSTEFQEMNDLKDYII